MRRLSVFISMFLIKPAEVALLSSNYRCRYRGSVSKIPEPYLQWFVLDHTKLSAKDYVEFIIVEDIGI